MGEALKISALAASSAALIAIVAAWALFIY